jgi:uncharacterized protein (DUF433 family)
MDQPTQVDLSAEPAPVAYDADGVLRVRGTRVRLDTVVSAFQLGATAEEIAQQYPAVDLPAAYAVIAFYLRRRPEVDAYLAARAVDAAETRASAEARFEPAGMRERLLARRGASRASA